MFGRIRFIKISTGFKNEYFTHLKKYFVKTSLFDFALQIGQFCHVEKQEIHCHAIFFPVKSIHSKVL